GAWLLPWTSSIDTTKARKGTVTALFVTSRAGGLQTTTALLDPSREFPRDSLRPRVLAALVNPLAPGDSGRSRGRVVVVGTGDFASDRYAQHSPENLVFVQNAVGWLAKADAQIALTAETHTPHTLVVPSSTRSDPCT